MDLQTITTVTIAMMARMIQFLRRARAWKRSTGFSYSGSLKTLSANRTRTSLMTHSKR